jgi:hypothetical protein
MVFEYGLRVEVQCEVMYGDYLVLLFLFVVAEAMTAD